MSCLAHLEGISALYTPLLLSLHAISKVTVVSLAFVQLFLSIH